MNYMKYENRNKEENLKRGINIKDYVNADGTNSDSTALTALLTSISTDNTSLYLPTGTYLLDEDVTIPSNVELKMDIGAKFKGDAGTETITINGFIDAGPYQIFEDILVDGETLNSDCYVEWFGAVADESTDCTDAFEKAISFISNDSSSALGGTINLLSGIYMVSTITIAEGVKIKGKSTWGTTIRQIADTNSAVITINACNGAALNDFTIDGNVYNQTGADCCGVHIFKDTTILPASNSGYDNNRLLDFKGLNILSCLHDGVLVGYPDESTETLKSTGVWVFNLADFRIAWCRGYGINNYSSDNAFTNVDILDCFLGAVKNEFSNCRYSGGKWYGCCRSATTSGTIYEKGRRTVYNGIELQDNCGHGILIDGAESISLTGCIVDTAGFTYTLDTTPVETSTQHLIKVVDSENIMFNGLILCNYKSATLTINYGVRVETSKNVSLGVMNEEEIERLLYTDGSPVEITTSPRMSHTLIGVNETSERWVKVASLYFVNASESMQFSCKLQWLNTNNFVHVSGFGNVDGSKVWANGKIRIENLVTNNTLPDVADLLYAAYKTEGANQTMELWANIPAYNSLRISDFVCNGNCSFDQGSNKLTRDVSYNVWNYQWNDLFDSPFSTASIDTTGHTEIEVYPPYFEGDGTYDPAEIAAGGYVTTDITVTGCKTWHFPMITFTQYLAGIIVVPQIRATNTVTLTFYNTTAGALDLPSGSVKVRVMHTF